MIDTIAFIGLVAICFATHQGKVSMDTVIICLFLSFVVYKIK